MLSTIRKIRRERYIANLQSRGLVLGKNTFLNDGFFLDPAHCHLIEIQDDVTFGPAVKIFAHDASSLRVVGKTRIGRVIIKRGAFIGANSVILPGVTIGESSIVAASSVVTSSIPAREVWGGSPARHIMTVDDFAARINEGGGPEFSEAEFGSSVITPEKRAEMLARLEGHQKGFMVP